ncbi:putative phage abortive infection protein [Aliarcobacter butzleri]|uniref:putative phage abortive infection protein n=1 Tax=Aliarcobacter butzleri TaxID=28197 RepID=UPI001EDAED32|nr:putative phage abortive infection protein [Aliarcobacter butzleri]MCG3658617.1 putative phage abortive infection protein [Aliarcobacter butzleri]
MAENKKKKDIDFLDENYLKISNALNDEEKTRKSLFYIFIIALCIIGSIFLIELILVICFYDIDKLGAFGDFFGGMINPLLTFCTFMALLMTIILQQRELKLSREQVSISVKELGETRKATEISSQALTEQSTSLKLQNFETTFFNMISLHNEIVSNIKIKEHFLDYYSDKSDTKSTIDTNKNEANTNFYQLDKIYLSSNIIIGREAIESICNNINGFIKDRNYETIKNKHSTAHSNLYKVTNINNNRIPTLIYDLCHQCYSNIIGHYFGNIYQILKFISTSSDIDKRKYSDLFRAQFSAQELQLLFYHCSASIGSTKFKPLIEEFEFLEHLSIEENNIFFEYILYKSIYQNTAFGIKNIQNIEHIKSRIINKINTQIERIKEEKYKYLDLYKYFSEKDIEIFLSKVKEDSTLFTKLVAKKLALVDYSKEDSIKNYTFKEE